MASQSEARRRLAALMDQRRLELRLTWQDVAERGGASLRALANARTGDSEIRQLTQAGIEAGLQWEPGSVGQILGGGEALLLEGANPLGLDVTDEMLAAMRPHIAAVRFRVEVARKLHPGERLTGAMVFGAMEFEEIVFDASPADADTWDRLAAGRRGTEPEGIGWGVAAVRTWEAEQAAASGNANTAGLAALDDQRP